MNLDVFLQANRYDTNAKHFPTDPEYFNHIVELFNKYNVKNEQLTQAQWNILEEIIENKKIIEEKLKPLKQLVNYQISVVGGALRDLVIGAPELINDYDIVLTTGYSSKEKMIELAKTLNIRITIDTDEFEQLKDFRILAKKEQLESQNVAWELIHEKILLDALESDYYFSQIVKVLVSDLPENKHFSSKNAKEEYINYHIMSINQFSGANNKKVDLIISDYQDMSFLTTFDVEVCKLYLDLHKVKSKEDIVEKIIQTGSMLTDLENKTLSINAIKFPTDNLEYFFSKHIIKLLDKFPDYKINIFTNKPMDMFTHEEKLRWVYAQNLKMNLKYPEKGNNLKRLKI